MEANGHLRAPVILTIGERVLVKHWIEGCLIGFRAVLGNFREETSVLAQPGVEQEFHGRPALCLLTIQSGKFLTCWLNFRFWKYSPAWVWSVYVKALRLIWRNVEDHVYNF